MDHKKEITILGAGPAGMSAAIYLKRAGLQPVLLEAHEPGGLLRHASCVENYAGFPQGIPGVELAGLFAQQLHRLEIVIDKSTVNRVDHKNSSFIIKTDTDRFVSSAIIIATGTKPRKIRIRNSSALEGIRLFYDPFSIPLETHKEKKRILVIGGGDIAFDYTMTLLQWHHEVTIITRSEPTCLPLLYNRVIHNTSTILTNCVPVEIRKNRKDLLLLCKQDKKLKEIPADFLVIACGREPNIACLSPTLKKYHEKISEIPKTPLPGLYFAGDVVRGIYRQVGIAVGDGMCAAMMVEQYLKSRMVIS